MLCDTMGYCGQGVAQGGIVDTPDHKWYAVFSRTEVLSAESRFLCHKMGEKCQSYLYAGAGRTKRADHKRKLSVLGDSGRALCEVETKSTRPEEQYHSLVESDDFSEWNPDQKRLFGTFGWKSCWQFNHEPELPGLRMMQKKGASE